MINDFCYDSLSNLKQLFTIDSCHSNLLRFDRVLATSLSLVKGPYDQHYYCESAREKEIHNEERSP